MAMNSFNIDFPVSQPTAVGADECREIVYDWMSIRANGPNVLNNTHLTGTTKVDNLTFCGGEAQPLIPPVGCLAFVVGLAENPDGASTFATLQAAVDADKTNIMICADTDGADLGPHSYHIWSDGDFDHKILSTITQNGPFNTHLANLFFATQDPCSNTSSSPLYKMYLTNCHFDLGIYWDVPTVHYHMIFRDCVFREYGLVYTALARSEGFEVHSCVFITDGETSTSLDLQTNEGLPLRISDNRVDGRILVSGTNLANSWITGNTSYTRFGVASLNVIGLHFTDNNVNNLSSINSTFTGNILEGSWISRNLFGANEVQIYYTVLIKQVVISENASRDGVPVPDLDVGLATTLTSDCQFIGNSVSFRLFKGTFKGCTFAGNRIKYQAPPLTVPWRWEDGSTSDCAFSGNVWVGPNVDPLAPEAIVEFLHPIDRCTFSGNRGVTLNKTLGSGAGNLIVGHKGAVSNWDVSEYGLLGPVNAV